MDNKGQLGMDIINIMIFVIIGMAVGLALFTQFFITDQERVLNYRQDDTDITAFNETITLDFGRIVDITVVNASCDGTDGCNSTMRRGSEYSLTGRTGSMTFFNRTGLFNLTYDYDPTSRLNTQAGRSVVSVIPVLFAVGLLVWIVRRIIAGTT